MTTHTPLNMAPLFMIQLEPDALKAARWMEVQKVSRIGHDDGYGWHALLAACFGDLAPKPFRVIERPRRPPQLLGYGSHDIAALREHAATFAEPAAVAALGPASAMASKQMPGTFRAGQRLGFEVRVRPTVRQDRDGDRAASREIDAFLAAVQAADKLAPRGQRPDLERTTVYRDWLALRFGAAAQLVPESFRIESLRRAMLLRRRQQSAASDRRELVPVGSLKGEVAGQQGGSPDAVMSGTLVVESPSEFVHLLARGIGRHRAFGFGMLLLRPPSRE
jgi:CRISPR system Cascade subunit CasE